MGDLKRPTKANTAPQLTSEKMLDKPLHHSHSFHALFFARKEMQQGEFRRPVRQYGLPRLTKHS